MPAQTHPAHSHAHMPSFSERIAQTKQQQPPPSAAPTAGPSTAASVITSPTTDARRDRHREPQLYVWVVTINREVTTEEFHRYLSAIDPTLRRTLESTLDINRAGKNLSTLRKIVADLLPRMLMTRQRIPHSGWRFAKNTSGKWFIDSPPPSAGRPVNKVMGYGLAERDSVIAMAFAQGYKQQVVNIGMDIVRIPDYSSSEPHGGRGREDEAEAFIASLMHKLAPEELSQIVPALPVEKKLSRLCIMLAVKEAYLKALGQPHGFDLSRIAVNINPGGRSTIAVDKQIVNGWEFRLFTADIGVAPALRDQQRADHAGPAPPGETLDVRGRPTDPNPRSFPPAQASSSSSRLVGGAGPSTGLFGDIGPRLGLGRSMSMGAGVGLGSASTTTTNVAAYARPPMPPTSASTTRIPPVRSISSASMSSSSSALSSSSSRTAASTSSSRTATSGASSATPTAAGVPVRAVTPVRAVSPTAAATRTGTLPFVLNGVKPPPPRATTMPAVVAGPVGGSSRYASASATAGTTSGHAYSNSYSAYPTASSSRLVAGQGPAAKSAAVPPPHPTHSRTQSYPPVQQQQQQPQPAPPPPPPPAPAPVQQQQQQQEAPRVIQERYQCATAIWRGWKDRTEVVFAERDRDEMTSWLQFLTVTALARSVGSGGARGDATPAS